MLMLSPVSERVTRKECGELRLGDTGDKKAATSHRQGSASSNAWPQLASIATS